MSLARGICPNLGSQENFSKEGISELSSENEWKHLEGDTVGINSLGEST